MDEAPAIRLDRYDQSWYSRGRGAVIVGLWDLVQTCLIRPSPHVCFGWRRFWYRLFGARIGRGVLIRKTVECNYPWRLTIGEHAWIGERAHLYALDDIEIGAHAVISQQAYICTGSHDLHDPHFGLQTAPVHIGAGAWVALGATVMPGVRVGAGAVVGARALLLRDAEPWTVYLGAPARAAGQRMLRACAS